MCEPGYHLLQHSIIRVQGHVVRVGAGHAETFIGQAVASDMVFVCCYMCCLTSIKAAVNAMLMMAFDNFIDIFSIQSHVVTLEYTFMHAAAAAAA
jgi:hypothetical protein